jgi:hypothetical protein
MLRLLYTSSKVAASQTTTQLVYMPSIDAFHAINMTAELNIVRRVYRDGTLTQMGTNGSSSEAMHYAATVDPCEMLLWSDPRVQAYAIHPISWTFDFTKPFTTAIATGDWSNDSVFWREPDGTLKYIKITGVQSAKQLDSATGADEGNTQIFSGGDLIDHAPMLMGGNLIGFKAPNTGRIKVLNWVTKEVVLDSFITIFAACAFDLKNRLFVSIRDSDDRMQVWSEEIEPAAVSNPVGTPGSDQRYLAETMSVIVTGSNGELIPNVLVDWTVVENPGLGPAKGKMSPIQSVTNAAGVATSVYCPPGLDWVIGDDELITATVTV